MTIDGHTISNLLAGGVILIVLVLLFLFLKNAIKKEEDLGVSFIRHFVQQEFFWLNFAIGFLMLGEAAFVAAFHPEDEMPISEVARFIAHFGVAFVGFITTINAPKKLAELFYVLPPLYASSEAKKKRKVELRMAGVTLGKIISMAIHALLNVVISIGLPVANLLILSSGLNQFGQFYLFILDIYSNMSSYYETTLVKDVLEVTNLPPDQLYLGANYSPYLDMKYPLQISLIMVGLHYLLALSEGIAVMAITGQKLNIILPKKENSSTRKSTYKKGKEILKDIDDPLKDILSFYGLSEDEIEDKIDQVMSKLADVTEDTARIILGNKLSAIAHKVSEIKDTSGEEARSLRREIRSFFRDKHTTGAGFGVSLSKNKERDD